MRCVDEARHVEVVGDYEDLPFGVAKQHVVVAARLTGRRTDRREICVADEVLEYSTEIGVCAVQKLNLGLRGIVRLQANAFAELIAVLDDECE